MTDVYSFIILLHTIGSFYPTVSITFKGFAMSL